MRSTWVVSATANTTGASTRPMCVDSSPARPPTRKIWKRTSRTATASSCRPSTACSRKSEFPAHTERGQNRQPREGRAPREVVRIAYALDVFVVVDVLHVEVDLQHPPFEHEVLVDANVELLIGGQARRVDRARNRAVGVGVGVVKPAEPGRVWVTADV